MRDGMLVKYVPKLSREEMERRRLATEAELLEGDPDEWGHQARIARKYGVHPGNVCRWARRVRAGCERIRVEHPPHCWFDYSPTRGSGTT